MNFRRFDARAQRRADDLRARLAEVMADVVPDRRVRVDGPHVVIEGRGLSRQRIDDARLRGIHLYAKGLEP